MVSNKRGRSIGDDATAEVIDRIVRESGMNNSAIDRASGGAIGYNRVRDIREKMKSGARISELLIKDFLQETSSYLVLTCYNLYLLYMDYLNHTGSIDKTILDSRV